MFIESENRALKAIEPGCTLLRSPLYDPAVQVFEFTLRVPRDLNAVCHACGEAD